MNLAISNQWGKISLCNHMQYWNAEKAGAIFTKEEIFLSIHIVSNSRIFTQIKSIEKSIYSCHLIYLFIFWHGKEKVKMRRKARKKLLKNHVNLASETNSPFRWFVLLSPLMIISAQVLETIFKKYIHNCFFS